MGDLNITDELQLLIPQLLEARAEFAVCGGVAVTMLASPRMTKDIDLLVPVGGVDTVLRVARKRGFGAEALPMTFDRGTPKERTIRRVSKIDGKTILTLDLILVEPSFGSVWSSRVAVEWRGSRVPVVSREGLILMKRLSNRAQDRLDLELLGAKP